MSMSISASSDYDWLLEERQRMAATGKSALTGTVTETQEVAQQTQESQTAQAQTTIRPSGGSTDVVEISAEARAYQAAAQASPPAGGQQDTAQVEDASQSRTSAEAVSDTAKLQAQTQTQSKALSALEDSEDEEETTTASVSSSTQNANVNLTTLTEQQISDLVDAGTITQTEANKELARREAARQGQQQIKAAEDAQGNPAAASYQEIRRQTDPSAIMAQSGAVLNSVA